MDRPEMIRRLDDPSHIWDIIIAGGGATGLGTAVEAASRGYDTLLVEQQDFCHGTSSRSTKLVHGGVRYLQQGNISLVLEALKERGLLIQNAPHLVHNLSFVVPNYKWWEGPFYGAGLKVYDMLAGKLGLGPSTWLSRAETLERIPTLEPTGLRGGVIYHDGQFDDARLGITLAQTAADLGATLVNYLEVKGLMKQNQLVCGVLVKESFTGKEYEIRGKAVINATGVFADNLLQMDDPLSPEILAPSQGVHIVLDKSFLPGTSAIMVPHTDDGRVLFAVPWLDKVVVGTTDTPVAKPVSEPRALPEELEFLLEHASRYLTRHPSPQDVKSVFAGLRPLVKTAKDKDTSSLSRDHTLLVSKSGLITIAGGKWTTYRKMGQDTMDQAAILAGLEKRESITEHLRIHGWQEGLDVEDPTHVYGSDGAEFRQLISENRVLGEKIHPELPYLKASIVWAVRREMAMKLEDILSRRTRSLLLDARAAIASAGETARLMAAELGKNQQWVESETKAFTELARGYLVN